jgi:hypothetical protein
MGICERKRLMSDGWSRWNPRISDLLLYLSVHDLNVLPGIRRCLSLFGFAFAGRLLTAPCRPRGLHNGQGHQLPIETKQTRRNKRINFSIPLQCMQECCIGKEDDITTSRNAALYVVVSHKQDAEEPQISPLLGNSLCRSSPALVTLIHGRLLRYDQLPSHSNRAAIPSGVVTSGRARTVVSACPRPE